MTIINKRLLTNFYKYWRYMFYNAWYELRYRYAGTGIGILWNVITPLFEIIIYTIVFSLLIPNKMEGNSYSLYLMAALLPWRGFTETIVQGSDAFSKNAIYLRRLAIPSEIFVGKVTLASLFLVYIYLGLIILITPLFGKGLGWNILFLPIVGLVFQGLAFGMGLALANLQILFPDVKQILQFIIPLWTWTMPIYYPSTIIPNHILPWLYINPPYAFIKSFRDLVLEDKIPDINIWLIMTGWIVAFVWLGANINNKLQSEVRDKI